jgi:exoribonuclease R
MNHQCGQLLKNKKRGIYRSASKKSIESNGEDIYNYENLSPTFQRVLQNVLGEYCSYEDHKPHELIGDGISYYTHITSPIRRIVDCVNLLELQKDQFEWSSNSNDFIVKWLKSIEFINKQTKSIRKLQNEVELLTQYEKNNKQIYTGSVFSRESIVKNENTVFKYRVFIPSIKLLTTMKSDKYIKDYSTVDFSIHLFLDESKMSQKARLQIA